MNYSDFKLMKLGKEDEEELAFLEKSCFSQPWSLEQIRQALAGKSCLLYGIKDNNRLIAYLSLQYIPFEEECELEVLNIATREEYRNKGLGARLLNCMLEVGKELNCSKIFLEVRVSNEPALHLYKKMGFQESGRRKNYYTTEKGKEDALLMEFQYPRPAE